MFYSNYDNYMQDCYCYNQYPNNRYVTYNPYAMNAQNLSMQNTNMQNTNAQIEALNNMYPSIYKIINPVVSRVLLGNNTQYLTEDILNNLADTVYGIVENQIDIGTDTTTASNDNKTTTNNINQTARTTVDRGTANSNYNYNTSNTYSQKTDNLLLKDLIRILILKEFSSKRYQPNIQSQPQQYPNPNSNPYIYNQPQFQPIYTY